MKITIDTDYVVAKLKSFKITKFLKSEWIYFIAVWRNFFGEKDFWKYFWFVYFIYFLGYFGLILADVYYIDDLGRAQDGYIGFLNFSRYLSENLSKLIHLNLHRNTDISPITQLIAMALLSFGSMVLVKIINKKQSYFGLLASIPLGLSPFFLENMSYKFDSPFMALALISPIIPFLFLKKKFTFFIVSVLSVLITLNTYQSANSVYLILSMFVILIMFINKNKKIDIVKNSFLFAISYAVSMFIYKFIILTEVNSYVSSGAIKENLMQGFLNNIKHNLSRYQEVINDTTFEYIFYILVLFFLISIFKKAKINKFNALSLGFAFIILSVSLSQGAYLILEKPLTATRAYNGIGVVVAIIFIYSLNFKFINLSKIFVCFSAYFLIIQANSYGNALRAQEEYSQIRIKLMYSDLNKLAPIDGKFSVQIIKGVGNSPVTENSKKSFPIINSLKFQNLRPSWVWTTINNFRILGLKGNYYYKSCFNDTNKIVDSMDTAMHKITKYDNNCFVIEFK